VVPKLTDIFSRSITNRCPNPPTKRCRFSQAGHDHNKVRFGEPISAGGMANRIDSIRSFFCDLIK
jgi:hypothetical protein